MGELLQLENMGVKIASSNGKSDGIFVLYNTENSFNKNNNKVFAVDKSSEYLPTINQILLNSVI